MSEKPLFHTTVVERRKFMELQWSLQQDIETLLLKYVLNGTFKFTPFCNLYKEFKFGLIYTGKYRTQDFGHYTEMVYYTVKKYFMHSASLYIQVGALYMLYSLYYKNPFLHLIKIRLLKDEFEKLVVITSAMRGKNELEVLYVFNKMLVDGVFDFVSEQYALGLETRFLLSDLTLSDNIFRSESNMIQKMESETENTMRVLYQKEFEYRELLKEYIEQKKVNIPTEPFNLKEQLRKILENADEPEAGKNDVTPGSSIGNERQQLRNKSFASKMKEKRPAYLDNFKQNINK